MRRYLAAVATLVMIASMMALTSIASAAPKNVQICPDYGDWVYTYPPGTWSLEGTNDLGSKKFDTNNDPNTLTISAPSGYLISGYCVKAGTDTYIVDLQSPVATLQLTPPNNKAISHFSLKFVKADGEAEWCSPGFWRANAVNRDADMWPVDNEGNPITYVKYNSVIISPVASGDPSLLEVLQSPGSYFTPQNRGAAFNAIGDYLSSLTLEGFTGERTNNCPLDNSVN